MLVKETKSDRSLVAWRKLADSKEKGFSWAEDVLVRRVIDNMNQATEVLLLPCWVSQADSSGTLPELPRFENFYV